MKYNQININEMKFAEISEELLEKYFNKFLEQDFTKYEDQIVRAVKELKRLGLI